VQIGSGAIVQPNVKIWPSKEVDEGATVTNSLIWGSQARRVLFGRHGIRGLVNIEITPEFCARLGSAYGAILPIGGTVTINRDAHYTPRMLKRAIVAGLPSTGINVCDLQAVPMPVARYFTYASQAEGGVHVRLSPYDGRMVDVKFFDAQGLDIDTQTERKIEGIFFREDFRRVYLDEIGRITYGTGINDTYIEAFLNSLRTEAIDNIIQMDKRTQHPHLVVDYASANGSDIFPTILRRLNLDVVELNANLDENRIVQSGAQVEEQLHRLMQITPVLDAQFGVRMTPSGERITLVDNRGRRVSSVEALAAFTMLSMQANNGGTVAVPVTAPYVFEEVAARCGGKIVRAKTSATALMRMAADTPDLHLLGDGNGGYIFPSFHPIPDGLFAVVKLMELLSRNDTTLSAVIDHLPTFHMDRTRVACRWESKGKVMRILNERYQHRNFQGDNVDGVKIDMGYEWVLILPDLEGPFFHVLAEGTSEERAHELAEKYAREVAELQ
jgi:mannose-1-phosphate guanylyltransferase/phosphomannomutase